MFPRPSLNIPAETNRVVQVKYTNPVRRQSDQCSSFSARVRPTSEAQVPDGERESMLLVQKVRRRSNQPGVTVDASLSLSGSNQAREGRLVDALAVRGDEGRDTQR